MTGNEALKILNQITHIHNLLIRECDKSAFYHIGVLSEELAMIVRISETTLKPKEVIHEDTEF